MARDDGEQQAMTSERLGEIRQTIAILLEEPRSSTEFLAAELLAEVERQSGVLDAFIEAASEADMQINERMTGLESDNERLRAALDVREAREAALLAVARMVAESQPWVTQNRSGHFVTVLVPRYDLLDVELDDLIEQARALLASTEQEGGGDGA